MILLVEVICGVKFFHQIGIQTWLVLWWMLVIYTGSRNLYHPIRIGAVKIGQGVSVFLSVDDHAVRSGKKAIVRHAPENISYID